MIESYQRSFTETIYADGFILRVRADCVIAGLFVDDGDGFRALSPLVAEVDGIVSPFPVSLMPGTHLMRLLGETFAGNSLLITGSELGNIISVLPDTASHEARLRDVESQLDAIVGDDGKLSAAGYKIGGTQVVGSRRTGWGTFTGDSDRSGFDTTTADAKTIAQHFKALVEDLTAHGLIGS